MQLTDKDYDLIFKDLRRTYGEDLAQDAIVRILEILANERGSADYSEIRSPLALAKLICRRLYIDQKKRPIVEIPLRPSMFSEPSEGELLDNFIDYRDPANQIEAKQILESLPQILIDQELDPSTDTVVGFCKNEAARARYIRLREKTKEAVK
jgi:DNA-directed RNA polymerase specialized sigma24 family protein